MASDVNMIARWKNSYHTRCCAMYKLTELSKQSVAMTELSF